MQLSKSVTTFIHGAMKQRHKVPQPAVEQTRL